MTPEQRIDLLLHETPAFQTLRPVDLAKQLVAIVADAVEAERAACEAIARDHAVRAAQLVATIDGEEFYLAMAEELKAITIAAAVAARRKSAS